MCFGPKLSTDNIGILISHAKYEKELVELYMTTQLWFIFYLSINILFGNYESTAFANLTNSRQHQQ